MAGKVDDGRLRLLATLAVLAESADRLGGLSAGELREAVAEKVCFVKRIFLIGTAVGILDQN